MNELSNNPNIKHVKHISVQDLSSKAAAILVGVTLAAGASAAKAEAHTKPVTGGVEAHKFSEAQRVAMKAEQTISNLDKIPYRNGLLRIAVPNKPNPAASKNGGVEAGKVPQFESNGMADANEAEPLGNISLSFINRPLWLKGKNGHTYVGELEWNSETGKPKVHAQRFNSRTMAITGDAVGHGEIEDARFGETNGGAVDLDHPMTGDYKQILDAANMPMPIGQVFLEDLN